jgi:hypothetical protein
MKKKIILLNIIIIFVFSVYANDTNYILSAGGNDISIQRIKDISINKEFIDIEMYKDYFKVIVNYEFKNTGDMKEVKMSFPEFDLGNMNIGNKYFGGGILRFSSFRNDEEVGIGIENTNGSIGSSKLIEIKRFFSKMVQFERDEIVKIRNEYSNRYSRYYNDNYEALYLYGTANSWGGISKIDVIIKIMDDSVWIQDDPYILLNGNEQRKLDSIRIKQNTITFSINGPLNGDDDIFVIKASEYGLGGILFDYDPENTKYSEKDVKYLTKNQIRILRNNIYAWRGYTFKNKDMINIFSNFRWYKSRSDFNESEFTQNEKNQIDFLTRMENIKQ